MKKRVYELARERALESKDILAIAAELELPWKTASSMATDEEQEILNEYFIVDDEELSDEEIVPKKKRKPKTSPMKKIKKKDKNIAGVQKRKMTRKTANFMVLGLAAFILGIGAYGTYRAYTFSSELLKAQKSISALQKVKVTKTGTVVTQKSINYPLVNEYFTGFVKRYMNVDTADLTSRDNDLKKYTSYSSSEASPTQNRVLDSSRLFSVEDKGDFYLTSFLVTYHFNEGSTTSLLNIPYTENNQLFSIISAPYFSQVPDSFGQGKALVQIDSSDHSNQVESNQKAILKFLTVFFEKYAGSQTDDLKLLMRNPEYQGGNFSLNQLDISAVKMLYQKDKFIIQAPVSFKDNNTNFVHTENFTLTVEKRKDGTFFVDELKHYYVKEK